MSPCEIEPELLPIEEACCEKDGCRCTLDSKNGPSPGEVALVAIVESEDDQIVVELGIRSQPFGGLAKCSYLESVLQPIEMTTKAGVRDRPLELNVLWRDVVILQYEESMILLPMAPSSESPRKAGGRAKQSYGVQCYSPQRKRAHRVWRELWECCSMARWQASITLAALWDQESDFTARM